MYKRKYDQGMSLSFRFARETRHTDDRKQRDKGKRRDLVSRLDFQGGNGGSCSGRVVVSRRWGITGNEGRKR